jgi:hypothetical protein
MSEQAIFVGSIAKLIIVWSPLIFDSNSPTVSRQQCEQLDHG